MKQMTYEKCRASYIQLVKSFNTINNFRSLDELVEAIEQTGKEVSGVGDSWFITRKTDAAPFGPDNIDLIEVIEDEAYGALFYPSF